MLLSAYEAIQLSNCFRFKWLYSVISILFNITFTFTVDWRLKKSNLTFQQSSPIARVYNSVQTAVDRFTALSQSAAGRSADRLTCYRCCCLHVWQWTSVTIIWFDFDSTAVGMAFDVKWQLNDSQIMQRMPLSPVAWLQNGWHSRKLDFFPPILELQMQDRSTDGQKAMARTANSKRNRHSDSTTRQFSSSATLTFDLMTQIDTPGRLKMSLRVPNLLMHSIYLFLHHRAEIRTLYTQTDIHIQTNGRTDGWGYRYTLASLPGLQ